VIFGHNFHGGFDPQPETIPCWSTNVAKRQKGSTGSLPISRGGIQLVPAVLFRWPVDRWSMILMFFFRLVRSVVCRWRLFEVRNTWPIPESHRSWAVTLIYFAGNGTKFGDFKFQHWKPRPCYVISIYIDYDYHYCIDLYYLVLLPLLLSLSDHLLFSTKTYAKTWIPYLNRCCAQRSPVLDNHLHDGIEPFHRFCYVLMMIFHAISAKFPGI